MAPLDFERVERPGIHQALERLTVQDTVHSLDKIENVLVGTAGLPACYNRICDIGAETFYSLQAEADIAFLIDREMGI